MRKFFSRVTRLLQPETDVQNLIQTIQNNFPLAEIYAAELLAILGLVKIPETCPNSHQWSVTADAATETGQFHKPMLRCSTGSCTTRWTLRAHYVLAGNLPFRHEAWILQSFLAKLKPSQVAQMCKIDRRTVADRYSKLRVALRWEQEMKALVEPPLGGDDQNTFVCVDETFKTTWKFQVGGRTVNMTMMIMGAAEARMRAGGLTGRVRFEVIPDRTMATFMVFFGRHISPTAVVYTDSHRSYNFVEKTDRLHQKVNHSRGEFINYETGATTNHIKGIWSNLKRRLREQDDRSVTPESLMEYAAEVAWRLENCKLHGEDWAERKGVRSLADVVRRFFASLA
jgi:transposase-like protein